MYSQSTRAVQSWGPLPLTCDEKRRAVEDMFLRNLSLIEELKKQVTSLQQDKIRSVHRENELLSASAALEASKIEAESHAFELQRQLREEIIATSHRAETVLLENITLREALSKCESRIADQQDEIERLKQLNEVPEKTTTLLALPLVFPNGNASRQQQQVVPVPSPPLEAPQPFTVIQDDTRSASVPDGPLERHVEVDTHQAVAATSTQPPTAPQSDGGGEAESSAPTVASALQSTPSHATIGNRENEVTPVASIAVISPIPSVRRPPPPPARRPKTLSASPSFSHQQSEGNLMASESAVVQPTLRANSPSTVPRVNTMPIQRNLPQASTSGATASGALSSSPPSSSSPARALTKFNFSQVSKLDCLGSTSNPGYLALVEHRFVVHLASKPSANSKAPKEVVPSNNDLLRCAVPAHPIKIFGGSWHVFQLVDHGRTLPNTIESGCLDPLPTFLQHRLNTQQYMRVSHILNLFLDVALALQQLHRNQMVHGNLDMWSVFVPKLPTNLEGAAPPNNNQPLILSSFSLEPAHRNPLYRAPEVDVHGTVSTASDIWSLGVLLWEITNYGVVAPYSSSTDAATSSDDASAAEALFARVKRQEIALECPEQCPASVFSSVIAPCLEHQPGLRPSIDVLVAVIQNLVSHQ